MDDCPTFYPECLFNAFLLPCELCFKPLPVTSIAEFDRVNDFYNVTVNFTFQCTGFFRFMLKQVYFCRVKILQNWGVSGSVNVLPNVICLHYVLSTLIYIEIKNYCQTQNSTHLVKTYITWYFKCSMNSDLIIYVHVHYTTDCYMYIDTRM